MLVEPAVNARDSSKIVGRGGGMGGEGGKRLVVGEGATRDVVRALPGRTRVGIVADILLVERRAHVEGVERRVVVVAQPAPDGELAANLHLLLRKDVHACERGVVVERVPVELLHVVAKNKHLQVLALLQGAAANLLAGTGQDERLQVVALQERVRRQHVLLVDIGAPRGTDVGGYTIIRHLEVSVVQVDVFQVTQVVAAVAPRTVAGEIAQQAQVGAGDRADHLQSGDMMIVAVHAVKPFVVYIHVVIVILRNGQPQFLGQRIRLLHGDRQDLVAGIERVVGVDVVGILRPLLTVQLAELFRDEDAEVVGQTLEGILRQLGHGVAGHVDRVEAVAVGEGSGTDALQRVGQRDDLQVEAVAERLVAQ